MSKNLGGSLNIRASGGDGNIVTFASKDSKLAQYIDITSAGVKLNCKVNGEWGNTINLATKDDLGVTQYNAVVKISLSGKLSNIGEWVENNGTPGKCTFVRVEPSDSDGYFGTAGFGILWMRTSVNYGWCILISDNPKMVVFGRNSEGWHWYAPALTEVS